MDSGKFNDNDIETRRKWSGLGRKPSWLLEQQVDASQQAHHVVGCAAAAAGMVVTSI